MQSIKITILINSFLTIKATKQLEHQENATAAVLQTHMVYPIGQPPLLPPLPKMTTMPTPNNNNSNKEGHDQQPNSHEHSHMIDSTQNNNNNNSSAQTNSDINHQTTPTQTFVTNTEFSNKN